MESQLQEIIGFLNPDKLTGGKTSCAEGAFGRQGNIIEK
jgi:hypothetical protein